MADHLLTNVDFPTFGLPIIETNPDLCSVIYSKSFPEIQMVVTLRLSS